MTYGFKIESEMPFDSIELKYHETNKPNIDQIESLPVPCEQPQDAMETAIQEIEAYLGVKPD